jgi:predicted  nucleic acid-binding Zn-ribbon protein
MTETKTKKSVDQSLRELFELQLIDRKLDKIRAIRGELPMEVQDLEDEIAGLQTRIQKLDDQIQEYHDNIQDRKNRIKEAEELKKKYESQQESVKNNREYLALSKEIELQDLEVMASQKKIKDQEGELKDTETKKSEAEQDLSEKKSELEQKKEELDNIIAETEKEENTYLKLRDQVLEKIGERLQNAYTRIRSSFKNGLAVVTISRDSCGGCFSDVPPQRQLDVATHKSIITCENCGRILLDSETAEEIRENLDIEL